MRGAANPYYKIPMDRREAEPGERILLFKVIQSDRKGKVRGHPYRILSIPERITLFEFAGEICREFHLGFDHMFGFYNNIKNFYQSTEGYELFGDNPETWEGKVRPEFKGVVKTPVNRAFPDTGKKMLFLFDYGDECYLRVELQEICDPEPGKRYPALEKSEGKAIPHPPGQRLVFRI
jgi:hypothetical protein